jgi:hypothetical protein
VISKDKVFKVERVPGNSRIDGPSPTGVVYIKGLPTTPATNLVLLSTPDEVVFVWIKREENPEVPFRIGMKDDQITILLGTNLHLGSVAGEETAVVAYPDLDGRVILPGEHRLSGGAVEQQGK